MTKKKTAIWGVIVIVLVAIIWVAGSSSGNDEKTAVINRSEKTESVKQTSNLSEYAQAQKIFNQFKDNNGVRYQNDQTTTFTVMKNGNSFKFYSNSRPDGFYVLQRVVKFNSQDDKYSYQLMPVNGGTPMGVDADDVVAHYNNLNQSSFSKTFGE
ncbi:hypothetical protein [Companilactobacillus furfuricola]|uniref:hypothetical protein n=1 Tax=Companilactobacillus furfuricola TaxID=1462575 RepID=UPI000F787795|nr:hypothetical protein [Companilactobacillus furfuricola]